MSIAVIGEKNTGRSTWIGLLLQSMEKYTNEHPKRFSYYMNRETTNHVINNIRNPLLRGEFPDDFVGAIKLTMSFRKSTIKSMKYSLINKNSKSIKNVFGNKRNEMTLEIMNILEQTRDENDINKVVNRKIRKLFTYNALVILIDCSKLFDESDDYVVRLRKIFSRLKKYSMRHTEKSIVPVMFFTKVDKIPMDIIRKLPNYSENLLYDYIEYDEEKIEKDFRYILKNYSIGLFHELFGEKKENNILKNIRFYISWLGFTKDDKKLRVTRYKTAVGDELVSNHYPYKHYFEFIKLLEMLSYKNPDSKIKIEDKLS